MVTVAEAHAQKIESIRSDMKCPKDFVCCESGFENLCKAHNRGVTGYLDCLEEKATGCGFSVSFGHSRLCTCPLRVYLGKKLRI